MPYRPRYTPSTPDSLPPLEAIRLEGFKSFRDRTEVAIKPLTLLAGRNSAGKSSLMQPLLLMKQTLEASFDTYPLLLDGLCVKVQHADSLRWQGGGGEAQWSWGTRLQGQWAGATLGRDPSSRMLIFHSIEGYPVEPFSVAQHTPFPWLTWGVPRDIGLFLNEQHTPDVTPNKSYESWSDVEYGFYSSIVHLPGLRGNPERAYPTTRVSHRFPGTFTPYTASVLAVWREQGDPRIEQVQDDLRRLGLSGAVEAKRLDDVKVELRVGRRLQDSHASVNIADVGFGVSQVMPVVVALRAALPGQTVHVEQPELHLHPNAQVAMAELLLDAARRGVRVIAETHSAVLLKAVQVAVAEGRAEPELVALHWFDRDEEGATQVTTAELDSEGAYGAWPVDFADVELDIERRFIMAPFKKGEEG